MDVGATLFISSKDLTTLQVVATRIFEILGVELWEERFSSNYPPDEHYFAGYTENVELTISDADSNVMPEYPFHLDIDTATWRKELRKIDADPKRIAQALANCGFCVFVPAGAWDKHGWDGRGDLYAA